MQNLIQFDGAVLFEEKVLLEFSNAFNMSVCLLTTEHLYRKY